MLFRSLYLAGIETGDKLISVNGVAVTSDAAWRGMLAQRKPGESVPFIVQGRGGQRTGTITLGSAPFLTIETNEQVGLPVSDAQQAFRAAWLGSLVH